jgi:hypothetical protein
VSAACRAHTAARNVSAAAGGVKAAAAANMSTARERRGRCRECHCQTGSAYRS